MQYTGRMPSVILLSVCVAGILVIGCSPVASSSDLTDKEISSNPGKPSVEEARNALIQFLDKPIDGLSKYGDGPEVEKIIRSADLSKKVRENAPQIGANYVSFAGVLCHLEERTFSIAINFVPGCKYFVQGKFVKSSQ